MNANDIYKETMREREGENKMEDEEKRNRKQLHMAHFTSTHLTHDVIFIFPHSQFSPLSYSSSLSNLHVCAFLGNRNWSNSPSVYRSQCQPIEGKIWPRDQDPPVAINRLRLAGMSRRSEETGIRSASTWKTKGRLSLCPSALATMLLTSFVTSISLERLRFTYKVCTRFLQLDFRASGFIFVIINWSLFQVKIIITSFGCLLL